MPRSLMLPSILLRGIGYLIGRFAHRDHGNIVHWRSYDRGSHFAPHDAPDLLLTDIRDFYRGLR